MASPTSPPTDPYQAQQLLLDAAGISAPVVFDVGANAGQAAGRYLEALPDSRLYCFEPFPDSLAKLRAALGNDPRVEIVPLAVADRAGDRTFHVNAFDPTNSLLPRPATARRYYPQFAAPVTTTGPRSGVIP